MFTQLQTHIMYIIYIHIHIHIKKIHFGQTIDTQKMQIYHVLQPDS